MVSLGGALQEGVGMCLGSMMYTKAADFNQHNETRLGTVSYCKGHANEEN